VAADACNAVTEAARTLPAGSLLAFPDIDDEGVDENGHAYAIVSFHLNDTVDGSAAGTAMEQA
jgi:hypothetical protein